MDQKTALILLEAQVKPAIGNNEQEKYIAPNFVELSFFLEIFNLQMSVGEKRVYAILVCSQPIWKHMLVKTGSAFPSFRKKELQEYVESTT